MKDQGQMMKRQPLCTGSIRASVLLGISLVRNSDHRFYLIQQSLERLQLSGKRCSDVDKAGTVLIVVNARCVKQR